MEELEERHQVEIKVYKQKVKHLLYEHQNNISHLKEESEVRGWSNSRSNSTSASLKLALIHFMHGPA